MRNSGDGSATSHSTTGKDHERAQPATYDIDYFDIEFEVVQNRRATDAGRFAGRAVDGILKAKPLREDAHTASALEHFSSVARHNNKGGNVDLFI